MNGSTVYWMLELAIKDGKQDEFSALADEMSAATKANEPGTLGYHWSLTDDRSVCHIFESYADSAAAMTHLGNFGRNFADRFFACVTPKRFTLYGDPDGGLVEALSAMGVAVMAPMTGFIR